MLTHPTLDQMATLGLTGMANAWKALNVQDPGQALDRNEGLGLMLDREAADRADKRFANRLRNAKMRFPNACIEDVDFAASHGFDRRQLLALAKGMDQGQGTDHPHRPDGNRKDLVGLRLCPSGCTPRSFRILHPDAPALLRHGHGAVQRTLSPSRRQAGARSAAGARRLGNPWADRPTTARSARALRRTISATIHLSKFYDGFCSHDLIGATRNI